MAVSQEDPRGAEPDHLCIDVLSANKHVGENTSVPIGAGDAQHDAALDHELREDLPGATAEGLALFRRVDFCEAHDQALTPVGEHGDVVSIADRDDAPAEFGGVRATCRQQQRGDDEQQARKQPATGGTRTWSAPCQ